ncbi:YDG domain-containing protein [Flavobacterium sp. AS60]|uniref:YDG domain-containing protein n=1 Tax=Flavobacterium anseongense TaxID=2910677 RepID=UPI001F3FD3F2|nr:YDG domain-containing protein [Flavobacterium sp. AS60]MCF6130182.1 YDG domain-containing protein [Flavobacterium sp. AS60]
MNIITTRFFQKKNKAIHRLLCLFALLLMTVQISWGQAQTIGSFPSMDGGMETQAAGGLSLLALPTATTQTAYTENNASSVGVINTTGGRSGPQYLSITTGSSGHGFYTPTASLAQNTQYVVQYYFKYAGSSNRSFVVSATPNGGTNWGTASTAANVNSIAVWTKRTEVITSANNAATGYGIVRFQGSGGGISVAYEIDDIVVYAGSAADTVVPADPTVAGTTIASGTSLNVNWTGLLNAGDGGGYVIVRSTSATAVTLNVNGIYGVGNTTATGGGTVVGIVPGVAGANTFLDTGLSSGVTYYYTIFAVDKAFNYCTIPATCSGNTGLTPPTLTADTTLNNVDNNIDITFTNDAAWFALVTAVKIGTTTLTAGTDYVLTAGNLQLLPSGLNTLLTTAGSKAVSIVATGYSPATVTQQINAGAVVAANSTATIGSALAPGTTQTITITARDQYNNLVSGYNFVYDATITNTNATTGESYTIDGTARTSTVNDLFVTTVTNASGVATFTVTLPATIDVNDGISVQVQLVNGTSNVGSAFSYIQLPSQTITFGALSAVTYGDANFNLTATASSGLTVSYSSSNTAVATVSGNTVTIVAPGTTNITASQAGNGSWAAATPVVQALTVNVKPLTISSAAASNKVYDGTTAATITGSLTGIINADVVTLTGTGTFASANVGTGIAVTSTSTLGGANAAKYSLTQPTGLTANITKANQTINIVAASLLNYVGFTDFTPPFASATSGTNTITFTSSNPAVATIVSNKVHYVGIGTTTITASQAASTNYNAATDVTRTLTVIEYPIAAWNFWTSSSVTQTNIQAYLYDAGLDTTTNNTVPAGTNTASSLAPKYITRGSSVAASGGTSAFRSTGFPFNTPTIIAPSVTSGNNQYFQVTLQAASAGKTVSISTIDAHFYDATNGFNTAPGVISQFGYSLDGGTTIVPIGSAVQSTSLRMGQIDVSGITALQDVPFGTTITLRYYASGYGSSGSGWGFGSPNTATGAGLPPGVAAAGTDGLVIGGDVSDSTTWTTGLVWTNGTPSATKNAIILGAYDTATSGGGFTAKKLTINGSGSLTIRAGATVTVQNQIINNAGANAIIIENTGSLVQVNDYAVNKGVINYKRQTNAISNFDYTYWSSPVTGFTLGGVSPNTQYDKFYSFNSTTQAWKQETTATTMTPAVGYIIRGPQLSAYMAPNPPSSYEATFVGVPNNGKYQISGIVANKAYLIGNPYPSALDADTFIDGNLNVLDGTLYFWTHNTPIAGNVYDQDDYASYNRTGSTGTAALNPGVSNFAPTGKIGSGQGFFANSKNPALLNGDTTIDFSNSMRVGVGGITGDNSQFFRTNNRTNTSIEKHRIWLNLTSPQGAFKQTLVGYIEGATNEYEGLFDGENFNANQYVNFYSINQGKNLTIQGRALPFDENDQVPLGFKTTITGPLTISIDNTDGLLADQNVYIEDLLTNTIIDITNGGYTFDAVPGIYNNRFILRYTNGALGVNDPSLIKNSITVYKSNGIININSTNELIANVKVYDLQGRLITEQKEVNATSTSIKNLRASQQVLIVKVTTQDNKVVTKKVVN